MRACGSRVAPVTFVTLSSVREHCETCPTDFLASDFDEPALKLIQPRWTGRREVDVIARRGGQPLLHFSMLAHP